MPRTMGMAAARSTRRAVAIVVAVGLAGCAPVVPTIPATTSPSLASRTASPSPSPSANRVAFDPTGLALGFDKVASGFELPLGIANAHDGTGRLFVVEQGGRVRIVRNGAIGPTPFLDLTNRISSGGERGL